jgi:hypothetical protein
MDKIGATKSVDAYIHGVFVGFAALNLTLGQRGCTPRRQLAQGEQKD